MLQQHICNLDEEKKTLPSPVSYVVIEEHLSIGVSGCFWKIPLPCQLFVSHDPIPARPDSIPENTLENRKVLSGRPKI